MATLHHPARRLSAAFALLFFATALGSGLIGIVEGRREASSKRHPHETEFLDRAAAAVGSLRRRLVGPGSSPPTCRARCGRCYPCRPVHVAIQPGRSFPLEYYPEAWRCKCGSKLFMP